MITNDLKGKKLCFLGDSITEGFGVNVGERYFDILAREYGFDAYGYGKCGARFEGLYEQALQMQKEHGENVDIIFVFAGTNNYNGSTHLGEWFTTEKADVVRLRNPDGTPKLIETRLKRTLNTDPSTYRGAISRLLAFLKEHYGTKRIILMTPLHRAYAEFGDENIQYNELYSNGQMLFIDDYVADVKRAAELFACELIDLFSVSGMYPLADCSAKTYFCSEKTDRLHPNKEGHRLIAKVIEKYL
jgi:lysophospholipase L1-like esterase